MEQAPIVARLRIIEGQIRGIVKLVEQDHNCSQILHQISAVRAASEQVGFIILENHLRKCLLNKTWQEHGDEQIHQLVSMWKNFSKM
ncbi:MAG TPA: metal-sensitive transcriptional regulator [Paenibacillus sp.]|uniref:metal-sensitive transcriptional regulator n=1 Tax=Paenibacillus sp. TaxID=58172 RepID=UPI002CA241E5|nr:metal-sensitive transcriptional regulator [Paenibacillus sp.]HUC91797.1 metal-sensitive transcriptional regulator [Paenibacillus sp.]